MNNLFSKTEDLAASIGEYVNARVDSLKLDAAEKSSKLIANGIAGLVVAVLLLFFLGLLSIGLSLALGGWIGNLWAGFMIMACFYLLTGIVVWLAREKLIRVPVINALVQQLFKHDEEDK